MSTYKFIVFGAMMMFCCPLISEAQKKQTLGGKAQQVVIEATPGKYSRGWIVKGNGSTKTFLDTTGKSIDMPANAVVYKIANLEKEYTKMQRDIRSKDEDKTSEYSNIFQWGYDRQLYEAVDQLAEKVLKRNPANPDPRAENAKDWAKQQLDTMKKTMSETSASGEFSIEDVQKIRFALLSPKAFGDTNPQIAFKNNVVTRFLKDMSEMGQFQSKEEQQAFRKLSPLEQALTMKKLTGNKYQADINIGKDPQLILDFKTTIQPMLSRSCAQANCHGGDTPKLQLTAKASTLPQLYYNYYAIDTFSSTQGTNQGDVIDHANPTTDSLLINYLLPSNLAPKKLAHTPTIPAAIKTKDDPRYAPLVKWLDAQPIYPIDELMSEKGATMVDDATSGGETTPETQPARAR
jgi:hypothetical protein